MKERNSFGMLFYSVAGVAVMAVLLVAANVLARWSNLRADLTAARVHTLTPATVEILKKLDTPVTVRLYVSRTSSQMPVDLKAYAGRVEDLLRIYQARAGSLTLNGKSLPRLKLEVLDPEPDSDAESSANLDGVTGQSGSGGEPVYCGLAVTCLDKTSALPLLTPDREGLLEYDLTSAISRVAHAAKPVIGVMSSLPVMGQMNPMFMQMGQRGGSPPWLIINELKRDYKLREVAVAATEIPAEVKVLLLIHPKNLTDDTLFGIDQFLLRGGRVLAFLDPMSWVDAQAGSRGPGMSSPPGPSSLGRLLKAWGVGFDTDKLVVDLQAMVRGRSEEEQMPAVLALTAKQCDANDPATAQIDSLLVAFAGAITGDGAQGLTRTVLLTTSPDSALVEKNLAEMGPQMLRRGFKPDNQKKTLAVRLTGTFQTAFPDGKPGLKTTGTDAAAAKAPAPLAKSAVPGAVVLVGDSDLLFDELAVQQVRTVYGQVTVPKNDNFVFAQNLVDQLAGDEALVSIRGRGAVRRPFLVVNRMLAVAEKNYQSEIERYEKSLDETRIKIGEIQTPRSRDQKFILSPEQKDTLAKFKAQERDTGKKLKDVRKALRRDIERLELKLKVANLAAMPILVALAGLLVAIIRKRRK